MTHCYSTTPLLRSLVHRPQGVILVLSFYRLTFDFYRRFFVGFDLDEKRHRRKRRKNDDFENEGKNDVKSVEKRRR